MINQSWAGKIRRAVAAKDAAAGPFVSIPGRPGHPAAGWTALLWAVVLLLSGCASNAPQTAEWRDGPPGGRLLLTDHYALHTTIDEIGFLRDLAVEMERSHALYRQLAPPRLPHRRLDAFVFAYRDEWVEHTRRTTGTTAAVYLQIHRGGYAHGEDFATFYHGGPQTLAVCRHEGWHQYVAAHFLRRPPAFLEEGIATLFEAGFDNEDLARPRMHTQRQMRLAESLRRQRLLSLGRLLTMHAGDVIGSDHRQVETFYAQAWALAHMLLADERYHEGFIELLRGYADGSAPPAPLHRLFELYLKVDFDQLTADYQRHVEYLAEEGEKRMRTW